MKWKSWGDWKRDPPPPLEYVIGPKVLYKQGKMMIFGPAGVGKSLLAQRLAFAVATGTDWMGLDIARPMKVGYSLGESHPTLMFERSAIIESVDTYDKKLLDTNLIQSFETQLMLDTPGGLDEVLHDIEAQGFEFLILDPLEHFKIGSDIDDKAITEVVRAFDKIVETGCTLCVVHHYGKGSFNSKGVEYDRGLHGARGKVALTANPWDTIFQVRQIEKEMREFRHAKNRAGPMITDAVTFDINWETMSPVYRQATTEATKNEKAAEYLPQIWTPAPAILRLWTTEFGFSERTARTMLDRLEVEKIAEVRVDPKRKNQKQVRKAKVDG